MNPNNQPFWKDDIENTIAIKPFAFRMSRWYAKLMVVVVQLVAFLIPAAILALLISPLLMYVWLIIVAGRIGSG